MANTKSTSKKAAVKKAAPKKAAVKKAAAKKTEVVKYEAKDVALTKAQESSLNVVRTNEERIHKSATAMLKLAFDSGQRMLKLKEEVQKKYGRVWKEWAAAQSANLGIGYEQVTRYMKLASNPDQYALLDDSVNSIEGAVKQIEHMKNPAKAAARAEARAARQPSGSAPAATLGIISNATLEEVASCNDVEELRGLIKLCHARIDELQADPDDDVPGTDDAADQADIEVALG